MSKFIKSNRAVTLGLTLLFAGGIPSIFAQSSVFQHAVFYNGLMEFSTTATMTINGRVHGNGNIYVGAGSGATLTFNDPVSCVGLIATPPNNGTASFGTTTFNGSPGKTTNAPAVAFITGTNNAHFLIDPPPAGENINSPIGWQRLYNQAHVILLVSNSSITTILQASPGSGQLPAADPSPTVLTRSFPPAVGSFSFVTTNAFFDQREGKTNLATQIDVGRFRLWLQTNGFSQAKFPSGSNSYPTILYAADRRTTTAGQLTAIRLTNGLVLPENGGHGWTVATPNPLYVWGNYNCTNTSDLGTSNTFATVPAALISDALTLLSTAWKDSASVSNYSISRNAAGTNTVNAAIITGNVPSTGTTSTTFSGGVHNFPRLLEDWSGCDLYLNTSLVCLYSSSQATNQFVNPGTYYSPATRHFNFDQKLLVASNQPPGTPFIVQSPTILVQPKSQTVYAGENVTFSVSATNAPLNYYQWYRTNSGGTLIAGEINSSLTITNVQRSQSGSTYFVKVTNHLGSVTSANATLTVNTNVIVTLINSAVENAGTLVGAGSLTLYHSLTTDKILSVTSSFPSRLSVPAQVTIPAGQTNVVFDLTVIDNSAGTPSGTVTVRVSDPAGNGGYSSLSIIEDDVSYFSFSTIATPQWSTIPFAVTITGRGWTDDIQTNFNGTADLLLIGPDGVLAAQTVSPTVTGNFTNGVWSGLVTVNIATNNINLYAMTPSGFSTGAGNNFDVTSAAALATLSLATDGTLQFDIAGVPGFNYAVEASTNFVDWTSLITNISPFFFTDPDTTLYPQRFYRVLWEP